MKRKKKAPDPKEHPATAAFFKLWKKYDWNDPRVQLAFKKVPLARAIQLKMQMKSAYNKYKKEVRDDLQQKQSSSSECDEQG